MGRLRSPGTDPRDRFCDLLFTARTTLLAAGRCPGHNQHVLAVRFDCGRQTLVYRIEQDGRTCHRFDRYSCFEDQVFNVSRLFDSARAQRFEQPGDLLGFDSQEDPAMTALQEEIVESARALTDAGDERAVVEATARLLRVAIENLVERGVTLRRVERELHGLVAVRPDTEESSQG